MSTNQPRKGLNVKMGQNIGAFLLVILSSWTSAQPVKASPGVIINKVIVFGNCCHLDQVNQHHKQCRCLSVVEANVNMKGNNNISDKRKSDPGKNVIQVLSQATKEKNTRSLGLKSLLINTHRNDTLYTILQRLSLEFSNQNRITTGDESYHVSKVIDRLQNSSSEEYSSSQTKMRASSLDVFVPRKRNWGSSYSQNVFVFGKDDRIQIVPPLLRKFPYSSIVRLSTGCTGTLVTPFHVLTAAHCVHNGRGFRNKLEMMKVEIPDTIGVRVYYIEKIAIPNRWLNPRSRNYQQASYDYAVVRLSYGVHGRYQFLPLSVPTEATLQHSLQFLGFPNYGYGLWRSVCPARTTQPFMDGNLLLARCDSALGNSGAAIFTTDVRSKKKVVGILSSTVSVGTNPIMHHYSIITAITEKKLLEICTEIGQIGVFFGVCPPEDMIKEQRGFQRKTKTIPFFG